MPRLICIFLFTLFSFNAFAEELSEQQKIDALLDIIGSSKITFIPRYEAYDGEWAKQFLRNKLEHSRTKVLTAKDFINSIAKGSKENDQEYAIILSDGTVVKSSRWFQEQLKLIDNIDQEQSAPAAAKSKAKH